MPARNRSSLNWAKVDLTTCRTSSSRRRGRSPNDYHPRCTKYFKGLSGQVKLFPVAFESGEGCVLVDVDGNRYIDFSSGIYVTTLGHCHPKVSEAVAKLRPPVDERPRLHHAASRRCWWRSWPQILPGDFSGFQFYDAGTAAVEAGMRVLRAATGHNEMLSCFNDFHGKTYGAVSLAQIRSPVYGRVRMPGAAHGPPARHLPPPVDQARRHDRHRPVHRLLRRIHPEGHRRRRGRLRAGADPGLGRLGHAAGRFLPQAAQVSATSKQLLLMADEVLTSWGRTGKWLCMEHWGVVPDVVAIGKGFGNGFPVTAVAVREPYKESFEKISASSSYGGNPMACAAALASTEVIEEENLLEHALHLGELAQRRMERMKAEHPIVGDVRAKGCLMGIELVKDRAAKTPFDEAGELVYQKAFRKGLAWIPAGHILRMSPPIVMDDDTLLKGLDMIDEAIGETEKELGYCESQRE